MEFGCHVQIILLPQFESMLSIDAVHPVCLMVCDDYTMCVKNVFTLSPSQ